MLKAMNIQREATEKLANIREETSPRPFSARRTNSGRKRSAATNRKNARSPETGPVLVSPHSRESFLFSVLQGVSAASVQNG